MKHCDCQQFASNRIKNRYVQDAFHRVMLWRSLYENGISMENEIVRSCSLSEAAQIVQVPRKTLEDYSQLFKKISLITDIEQFMNMKMGDLRYFVKKNKKSIKEAKSQKKIAKQQEKRKKMKEIRQKKTIELQQQQSNSFEYLWDTSSIKSPKLILFEETDSNIYQSNYSIYSQLE